MVVLDATNDKYESFSTEPQKVFNNPVPGQENKPKKPQPVKEPVDPHALGAYEYVFPQYPFNSQIGVAVAHVSPAGGFDPHGGCAFN
jgi:hypothetical protein